MGYFQIVLLLTAPVLIAVGASRKTERTFPFLLAALVLMAAGTASIVAEAGGTPHEELAGTAEVAFCALTSIFGCIVLLPKLLIKEPNPAISKALPAVFLIFYLAVTISLVRAAQQGVR